MVDFKDLVKGGTSQTTGRISELFDHLDRKTSHTELRASQAEALESIELQGDNKDHVLKISTGAGKTTVGLIYLWHYMQKLSRPGVYLCPTVQLVNQVCNEASSIGIPAVHYPSNERYPGTDAMSGKAVIVCSYEKLFNAKSTFNRNDVNLRPCAIVLDDVHSGVELVRRSFTPTLTGELRQKIVNILHESCLQYSRALWSDIEQGDSLASMEVPYWIWQEKWSQVWDALKDHTDESELMFSWPLIEDELRYCRCVISGERVEIAPMLALTEKHPAFHQADHRLFMSATLADDAVLVREMGLSVDAAATPSQPESDKGVGERMVLAPSLIDLKLGREAIISICKELSKSESVVVLTSSFEKAADWTDAGAKLYERENIVAGVDELKANKKGFTVFAQRYDGVDLPDSACRLLVIDGMPSGESLIDSLDLSLSQGTGDATRKLVYRIEQGMGRAVRSHADYAAVLLVGNELANFIAKSDVVSQMSDATRLQLDLAIELSKLLSQDSSDKELLLLKTINQCLNRDPDWKAFYAQRVRDKVESAALSDKLKLHLAEDYRKAYQDVRSNAYPEAVTRLRSAINVANLSETDKPIYLQYLAAFQNFYDNQEAMKTQRSAFKQNQNLMRPTVSVNERKVAQHSSQATKTCGWCKQFSNPSGMLSEIAKLRSDLNFSNNYKVFEGGLKALGDILGAESSRPDNELNEGPDVLWRWPELALVIEAKNEKNSALPKRDAGQLLVSLQWFQRDTPETKSIPVVATSVVEAERRSDYPDDTRVISPDTSVRLLDTIESMVTKLVEHGPVFLTESNVDVLLKEYELTAKSIVSKFTVPL